MENSIEITPPVLLIMFNRPHKAAQVFEKVRQVRPRELFIVVDGARPDRPGEAEKVQQCRAFKDKVDWDCNVKVNFAEKNMGCKDRIASGITWAFEHVDELIILEDDCVPDLSFFRFCKEMLEKYRDDNRVFTVAGSNHDGCEHFDESYAFSIRCWIWGWATWKRAWNHFNIAMKQWVNLRQDKYLQNIFRKNDRLRLKREFQLTYEDKINTWDYRWCVSCISNHALQIVPKVNLVQNTGFEAGGTHTAFPTISHLYMDESIEFPLVHPEIMSPLDRLFVPPTLTKEELDRILSEYDATFKQLIKFNQYHAVKILFKEILRKRLTNDNLTPYHLNFVYYVAFANFRLGDYEHAEELLNVLLTFNPKNVDLLLFLMRVQMQQGKLNSVGKNFNIVRELQLNDRQRAEVNEVAAFLARAQ